MEYGSLLNDFLSSVTKTSDCWIWNGPVSGKGLGRFRRRAFPKLPSQAHRAMWVLSGNPLRRQEYLIRTCKNKLCVRPDHLIPLGETLEQRFWERVHKTEGCWIWDGSTAGKGYGTFCVQSGKKQYAHRFSWELHKSKIPNGLEVCHDCDNPLCVNPDHLFVGTRDDNVQDMVKKGRSASGERNGQSKLTWEKVGQIRKLYPQNSLKNLAKMFGVSVMPISDIVNNKTWRPTSAPLALGFPQSSSLS